MHADKVSEIIAHFIGLFDIPTDEARLRIKHGEGETADDIEAALSNGFLPDPDFASNLDLDDYDPDLGYRGIYYAYDHPGGGILDPRNLPDILHNLGGIFSRDFSGPQFGRLGNDVYVEYEQELIVHDGPGSVISHVLQVNILYDDDYLNMTDGANVPRDTTFVIEQLKVFSEDISVFTPFSTFDRTDTYGGLEALAGQVRDYSQNIQQTGDNSLGTNADVDFVKAGPSINGTYVNGELVEEAPELDDYLPHRGLAEPQEEPEGVEGPLEASGPGEVSLTVEAGANIVVNLLSVVETGVMAPVTAVFGNYHQIDVISQAFIYSDRDEIDSAFDDGESASTIAMNIAQFERQSYAAAMGQEDDEEPDDGIPPEFPSAWRVSVIEGDVSFIHWIEQYQFVMDNDTMTVTSMGTEVSVLAGGNMAINIASFLGLGMQYDLVIVGGDVLDMNCISQISILYDNDWVRAGDDVAGGTVQSSGNLIWNMASINNIGDNDRFEVMPDYMVDTVNAINERNPEMPEGLSTDPVFAGYEGLNVLYITGNLFDVTMIKQVSILGDSDDVTQVANSVLSQSGNAEVTINTGNNAVVNIAEIADYDSFGETTYVGGQVYSDSVLIQGGLIEDDHSQPKPPGEGLANEVIAFLDDDDPESGDGVINAGNDYSWDLTSPSDVMQTVIA